MTLGYHDYGKPAPITAPIAGHSPPTAPPETPNSSGRRRSVEISLVFGADDSPGKPNA
ncbi:hypothetical protein [Pseudonocardia spinosispora]|uniref:hypothetical protein n=1 Tax=Pseudonocardia spinosispora TaxID=103441 RepID=UPI00040616E5|nr:hypothetical protein [Pseudonocardia spinosispora]